MTQMDKTHALKDHLLAVKTRKIDSVLAANYPEIDKLIHKINHIITQPITVAIMGEFSAGKSSFLNRLLGIDALPVSVLPKTATLTRLVYGAEAAVEIEYDFDGEVITKRYTGYGSFSELQCAAKVNDPVFMQELERIREVRVFVKNTFLTKLHLLDTPGFNHDQSMDEKSTNALSNTDIVIWIGDYNQLGKQTEFEKLKAIKQQIKHLYLIINKADVHISDSESYQNAQEELAINLSENSFLKFFQTDDIHLISSRATDSFWDGKFQQFLAHFNEAILHADLKISLSLVEENVFRLKQLLKDESDCYKQLQQHLVVFEANNNVEFLVAKYMKELFSHIGNSSSILCTSIKDYCMNSAKINIETVFSANSFVADHCKKDLTDKFIALQHDYGVYLNKWKHRYHEVLLITLENIVALLPRNHQTLNCQVNVLIDYFQLDDLEKVESSPYYLPATDRTVEILRLLGINFFYDNGPSEPVKWKLELDVLNEGILNLNETTLRMSFTKYIKMNIDDSILENYKSDISHIISNRIVKSIIAELNAICADATIQLDEATQIMVE